MDVFSPEAFETYGNNATPSQFLCRTQAVTMADDDNTTIQLVEETSSVDKERLVTGRVRVSTSSNSVDELAHATLTGVRVEVTREAIGREIDAMPVARVEGEITIIPVVEEIVVVEKRLVLVEEIRIRKIATSQEVSIPVTLRKQTATIERLDE
jgi:stress response protein YsnF